LAAASKIPVSNSKKNRLRSGPSTTATTPIASMRRRDKPRATPLGRYWSSVAAAMMRARVASDTRVADRAPFITTDTVIAVTPAFRATSCRVVALLRRIRFVPIVTRELALNKPLREIYKVLKRHQVTVFVVRAGGVVLS